MRVTAKNCGQVIASAIPELHKDVDWNEDLNNLTFADLFRWTEESTQCGNTVALRTAIDLVDSIFQDCDPDIRNAVTVSFLECIDPEDEVGRKIFDALTPDLKNQWQALDEYLQKLIGKSLRGSIARNADLKKA